MQVLPGSGRAADRLDSELIGWISTVSRDGRPQSSPVWFVVHDGRIYIQSQPGAAKLANVRTNDKVSFHLDSDGAGGDIVTVDGDAEVVDDPPPAVLERYLAKYERTIRERMQTTPEVLNERYSTCIRISPRRVRAW